MLIFAKNVPQYSIILIIFYYSIVQNKQASYLSIVACLSYYHMVVGFTSICNECLSYYHMVVGFTSIFFYLCNECLSYYHMVVGFTSIYVMSAYHH